MNKLKELRTLKGLTQDRIAELLEIPKRTYAGYERGERGLSTEMLQTLASFFDVSTDTVLGRSDEHHVSKNALRIPVLGSIPAGIPVEAIEDVIDWEEVPVDWGRGGQEYFALQIKGNSMEPIYMDGDVLIFRRQPTCESGQDCAVMVNGNDATFKRVHRQLNGITIQPLNPAYSPVFYSEKEIEELPVQILGVAVEIRRRVR